MKARFSITAALIAAACAFLLHKRPRTSSEPKIDQTNALTSVVAAAPSETTNRAVSTRLFASKIRCRAADFTKDEKSEFLGNFEQRYKPAISNWCQVYEGHVPFAPDEVTPDKLVERISKDPAAFAEYVFVINGITLAVRDTAGAAAVDYVNDPKHTRKMATLPTKGEAPIASLPVTREAISKILDAESEIHFEPHEIRMTPSGFSGGLHHV